MTSEYRASIQYLVCSNVLVYAHACVSACVRYRSCENKVICMDTYTSIFYFIFLRLPVFKFHFKIS